MFAAARPGAASSQPKSRPAGGWLRHTPAGMVLPRAWQFTLCTWRKNFVPAALGGVHQSHFGVPAKARLLWGPEMQTERRPVSPKAEPNKAQVCFDAVGGIAEAGRWPAGA